MNINTTDGDPLSIWSGERNLLNPGTDYITQRTIIINIIVSCTGQNHMETHRAGTNNTKSRNFNFS